MLIKKIADASGLANATVLNTKTSEVENKIPYTSSLVTTTILNTKFTEVDDAKCLTTQGFNKLTAEKYVARLKQADLVNKTDSDNKLTSFNKRITSNKTKYFEV